MEVRYQYLDEVIAKSGKSKSYLAEKLGISRQCLYNKIAGVSDFNADEAIVLAKELGITTMSKFNEVFFNH